MAEEKGTNLGLVALVALAIWYFFLRKPEEEPPPDGEPPVGVTVSGVEWA